MDLLHIVGDSKLSLRRFADCFGIAENAPSPEDPVIPTPTHDGPLPALPVIQGMSMDDYAIATGSGGMGAVVHETPYMQALGVTIDGPAPTSMNLVRNCAEASLLLSEQIREEGWHIADDGAVKYMGTEDIEDCDRSFGSMVSFGSDDVSTLGCLSSSCLRLVAG